ncbi:MAG TPA: TonB-dependent receptor [Candidatus Baltobacteraceae bacterium]|nr:TonB-dependent receptor [Candidatus Baltobacteraceae bacterium]
MQGKASFTKALAALLIAAGLFIAMVVSPLTALAGTTGIVEGTVTDAATGKPIADASVMAVSGSGTFSSVTDARGFYSIQNALPDTYTVRITAKGYADVSLPGIFVQQDATVRVDYKMSPALKTIATVSSSSASSLLKPYQGSDVYNVTGDQLLAATGGTDSHETEYQYIDTVPGVVGSGGYAIGQPSIRGGFSDVDTGFELDGVPITDRQTGFFGTNLTNIGVGNVEVITGGLTADASQNGTGVINQVSKVGTYPGYFWISGGLTNEEFSHFERTEWSGATPNGKFSWFISNDATNSQNYYWVGSQQLNGANYPLVGIPGAVEAGYPGYISFANAGWIWTRDVLGNFHWRPDARDDIQVLELNSYFNDQGNWGLDNPGQPALAVTECPGATGNAPNSPSTGAGGVAPNGQPCPIGLYSYDLAPGAGNFMGHQSNVFKIQWNHTINETSSFELHVAQFFNKYVFDQPYSDPNWPVYNSEWTGTGCPTYPVANGTPVGSFGTAFYDQCLFNLSDSYELRDDKDYFIAGDYTWTPNENVTVKAGVQQEYDDQIQYTEYLNLFNGSLANEIATGGGYGQLCYGNNAGSYPCINQLSDNPAHTPSVYGEATFNVGKFTLEPGIRWSRDYYGVPAYAGGTVSAGFFAPSLVGTYRMNSNNVFRYSYSVTANYVGSIFLYELNNPTFNPQLNGSQAYQPALNHMVDFQWEHAFNPETTLRFGPYWRTTSSYPSFYAPFLGYKPGTNVQVYGPDVLEDNLSIKQMGAELGISHVDPRPTGASWWISGSYCNCWTQIDDFNGGHGSYFNEPLSEYFIQQGVYLRSTSTPLVAATLTADLHTKGWHLVPYIYWTFDNFYNVGGCLPPNAAGTGYVPYTQNVQAQFCSQYSPTAGPNAGATLNPVLAPEGIGMGYWYANLTVFKDISQTWKVGVSMQNMFNMQHGPTPSCFNTGSGCWPYGPQSGSWGAVNTWNYQNFVNGTPRTIEVFARAYIGREAAPH